MQKYLCLIPHKMLLFHYLILFGSYNINIFCKPHANIYMASENIVVCEGGLLTFKSQCERVNGNVYMYVM
jgi:hypothetical protein